MMETYIINEIIKSYSNHQKDKSTSFYYYRDSQQNEIYLVILKDGKLITLECKNEKTVLIKRYKIRKYIYE